MSSQAKNPDRFQLASVPKEDLNFILGKVQELVPGLEFHNEKIFLTGGTGFFGKWITQALLEMNERWNLGNEISLLTRNEEKARITMPWLQNRPDIRFLEGDIRDLDCDTKFTTIIHGAAAASQTLNETRPDEMFDTILTGTRRVVAIAGNGHCRRLQFISSGAVYGTQPSEIQWVSEDYSGSPDPLNYRSAYAEGKRAAEFLVAEGARRHDLQLSVPRCFAFVGPYLPLNTHFAAGNFLDCVLKNEVIRIGGDGTPFRSYLYAADLVVWLMVHLLRKSEYPAMNVGSDQPVSILELAKATNAAGLKVFPERKHLENPIEVSQQPVPGVKPARYVPLTERARQNFGLQCWTPLSEALTKTLQWYRYAQPNRQ